MSGKVDRMTRAELEQELLERRRGCPRCADRTRQLLRAEAAVRRLEKHVAAETQTRLQAVANANRFHALLLQERVRHLTPPSERLT